MLKKVFIKLGYVYRLLLEPDELIDIFAKDKKIESIRIFIMYIIVGYIFQCNWPFPYFVVFVPCFCLIGIAAIFFINYFSVKMQIVTSSIVNQKAAENANTIYYSYGKKSIF